MQSNTTSNPTHTVTDQEEVKGDPYTMDFIKSKGGQGAVSKKTGLNRQTVRQIAIGRNAPSYDFIQAMLATYPDYDLRVGYRISVAREKMRIARERDEAGLPPVYPVYADYVEVAEPESQPAPLASSSATDVLIEVMKDRIKSLERQNTTLLEILSSYTGPHRHG